MGARAQRGDTQADQRKLGGALVPLPPSALLQQPWEVLLGSFPSAKGYWLTWRQAFNAALSTAGMIIFVLHELPSFLIINANGVFPARRITISNPSPDPARRSTGAVHNVLLCLGLNIDVMGRRERG